MQRRDVLPLQSFVEGSHSSILLHAYNSGSQRAQLGACTIEEEVQRARLRASAVEEKVPGVQLEASIMKKRCREPEVDEPPRNHACERADGADGGKPYF